MFPVEDNGTACEAPGRAASATSPESTASLKHQRSRMTHSHKQKSSAIASPKDVPSSEFGGASTPKKPKRSRRQRKAIGDLSVQDHPAFATPALHPPPATPLTASSAETQDDVPSLSQDSVVRPGICSPLRTAFSPGPIPLVPPTLFEGLEIRRRAKVLKEGLSA
ncbi:hypothetical protein HPB50_012840 [Hyalomma asiaticum]|uniref:Uncharacterized protein n=1 Tax=Hyalomma asiaticum TaxID=266040 RepID=A0ACB7RYL3_HYAAI|nr:hypothetical protein HPB50_012840 [Hyalomma asiaticum]